MHITYANIIDQAIERIPGFDSIYRAHLEDNGGETLKHPLFADLLRFSIKLQRSSGQEEAGDYPSADILQRIFAFVEEAAQAEDEQVVELVQLSFLENLHQAGSDYAALRSRLGSRSLQLLDAVEAGWNGSNS